jgi:hypothetical protein
VRALWRRCEPHLLGKAYVNHLAADDRPEIVPASFGENFTRLRQVKTGVRPHEDRSAVEDVMARYVWAVDSLDSDGYAAMFTDDARITFPKPGEAVDQSSWQTVRRDRSRPRTGR